MFALRALENYTFHTSWNRQRLLRCAKFAGNGADRQVNARLQIEVTNLLYSHREFKVRQFLWSSYRISWSPHLAALVVQTSPFGDLLC